LDRFKWKIGNQSYIFFAELINSIYEFVRVVRKMRSNKWHSAVSQAPASLSRLRRLSALCRGTLTSLPPVNRKIIAYYFHLSTEPIVSKSTLLDYSYHAQDAQ
jgi:hypothetical protein